MNEENILEVKDLEVKIEGRTILRDIDFEVRKGETVAVIGPNGAGKSVLFRTLLGIIPSLHGAITWKRGVRIGYVPQKLFVEAGLPLSVGEFLEFKKDGMKIAEAMHMVGLSDKKILNRRLDALSGGELQRVLIAWAILDDPDIILLDEPLTGIDIGGEETIYGLIHHLNREKKTTVIMISHDLSVVYKYADIVLCLNKKQVCLGRPAEVINAETTKKLYGEMVHSHDHKHEHNHKT